MHNISNDLLQNYIDLGYHLTIWKKYDRFKDEIHIRCDCGFEAVGFTMWYALENFRHECNRCII